MRYSILYKHYESGEEYTMGDETYATIDDAVKSAISEKSTFYAGFKVIQVIEWRAFDDSVDNQ